MMLQMLQVLRMLLGKEMKRVDGGRGGGGGQLVIIVMVMSVRKMVMMVSVISFRVNVIGNRLKTPESEIVVDLCRE